MPRRLIASIASIASIPLVLSLSCHRAPPASEGAGAPTAAAAASGVAVAAGTGRRTAATAKIGDRVDIPAGKVVAGSVPGDDGRDPTTEPIASSYELPAFAIDALPYPGKPGEAPLTGVSQGEAQKMCSERGGRLCADVEWERACRGSAGDAFGTGAAWDPTCAQSPEACVSGFGVRAMGAALEEWTASPAEVAALPGHKSARMSVRGATPLSPVAAHRCAARKALDAHPGKARGVGFRCCYGGGQAAAVPSFPAIDWAPAFRKGSLDGAQLGAVLGSFPELGRVRAGARLFQGPEVATVFEKAAPGDGVTVTADPIEWSPEPGADLLVFAGKSKGGSFIVALHRLPQGKLRLASSLVFANDAVPIALAYEPNLRREIRWSTSWGSMGEGGAITCRDDHRIVIVQR
jgi:hypothetical protein